MATYVLLMRWRDEGGMPTVQDILKEDAGGQSMFQERQNAIELGLTALQPPGKLLTLLWTLGEHDLVAIIEAADNQQIGGFALFLSELHGVRTETYPAFDPKAMDVIGQVAARCGATAQGGAPPGP